MNARSLVLDASALLAWILDEPGADTIESLLTEAVVPVSSLTETLVRAQTRGYSGSGAELDADLRALGIHVEPQTPSDAVTAAQLLGIGGRASRKRRLSLGDALCLAVAIRLELPVVTGDRLWVELDLPVRVQLFR